MRRRIQYFSGAELDRKGLLRRDPSALDDFLAREDALFLPVWRDRNLVRNSGDGFVLASSRVLLAETTPVFLGISGERPVFATDIADLDDPPLRMGEEFADLRQIGALLDRSEGAILAYARGMVHFHRTHRFCCRCGGRTESGQGGHIRRCTACATEHYPRTDAAVIMLVTAGDHCLLGRQKAWPPGMYSALAGFVEPGETLEEAVAREVMEETGIRTRTVRYHSSQPWPFPNSLMVGFTAAIASRPDPVVDPQELEAAAWFSRADIADFAAQGRSLPRPHSIARLLIEDWLAEE